MSTITSPHKQTVSKPAPPHLATLKGDQGISQGNQPGSIQQTRMYLLSFPWKSMDTVILTARITPSGSMETTVQRTQPHTFKNSGFTTSLTRMGYRLSSPTKHGIAHNLGCISTQQTTAYQQTWWQISLDPPLNQQQTILLHQRTYTNGARLTQLFPQQTDVNNPGTTPPLYGTIDHISKEDALAALGYRLDNPHSSPTTSSDTSILAVPESSDHHTADDVTWLQLLLPVMHDYGDSLASIIYATKSAQELATPFNPNTTREPVTIWTHDRVYFTRTSAQRPPIFESISRNPSKGSTVFR